MNIVIFRADERFVDTYFSNYPGYYDTMDAGVKDEEGYIKVCQERIWNGNETKAVYFAYIILNLGN